MSDGYTQVPANSTGNKVAGQDVTRSDGTSAQRQEMVIGDPSAATSDRSMAEVRDKKLQVEDRNAHLLERIAESLDEIRFLLKATLET